MIFKKIKKIKKSEKMLLTFIKEHSGIELGKAALTYPKNDNFKKVFQELCLLEEKGMLSFEECEVERKLKLRLTEKGKEALGK